MVFHGEGFAFVTAGRMAWVHRLRLEEGQVEPTADRIEAMLGIKGLEEADWWVGDLARPDDLHERLVDLGLTPGDPPELVSLTLEEPPAGEPSVEVRRVESLEELLQALEIDWAAFEVAEEERELRRREAAEAWPSLRSDERASTYLALEDGQPAGFARAVFNSTAGLLLGGATLPEARGRGVYTSLVHARWAEAVQRRVPRLVVSAGPLSAPILAKLGFEQMGRVRVLRQHL
jgi:GNAT superfamily N-acetyltransferase